MSNVSLIAQELTGMDALTAAWMGSLFTFSTGAGAILLGFVADRFGALRSAALMAGLVGAIIGGGLLMGMSTTIFIVIVALVGLSLGASQTFLPLITMESYGRRILV